MPSKTRPAPKPAARLFDGGGAIVTKTHDVEAAREVLLEHFTTYVGLGDNEALEWLQTYLDEEPILETGRWLRNGDDENSFWTPGDGRGATRAVVWYL